MSGHLSGTAAEEGWFFPPSDGPVFREAPTAAKGSLAKYSEVRVTDKIV